MQASREPDAELIAASRRGDHAAFARIIERYQRAVYAVSFSGVRDRALCDDITQDTFITAWRRLGDLRDTNRLPAWLCGIARNLAHDARKRRRRGEQATDVEIEVCATPFDALSDAESDRLLAAALARIPDAYREPLVLFYYERRSVEDVARILEISETTTHKRLSRGRRYLAERMTELVEHGLARRGPRAELVAGVLAAITITSASHVDASPLKGSIMQSKLTVIAIVTVLAGAAGVLSAGSPREQRRAAAHTAASPTATPRQPASSTPARTVRSPESSTAPASTARAPAAPALPPSSTTRVVPDCAAAAQHMAELELVKILPALPAAKGAAVKASRVAKYSRECNAQRWSENVRVCVVDADDVERAKIDCTDEPSATADEVAALPPELQCKPLADHVYALINGPDGKYTAIKKKLAGSPDQIAGIDQLTLKLRDEVAGECEQRPWAIEKRRCVAAAKTHRAFGDCH